MIRKDVQREPGVQNQKILNPDPTLQYMQIRNHSDFGDDFDALDKL